MDTWKIIIVSILAAVALGSIGGIIIGKYLVKREKSSRNPLLSKKERIVYLACLMLGAASILFGVFYKFPEPEGAMNMDGAVVMQDGQTTTGGGGAAMAAPRRGGGGVRVRVG